MNNILLNRIEKLNNRIPLLNRSGNSNKKSNTLFCNNHLLLSDLLGNDLVEIGRFIRSIGIEFSRKALIDQLKKLDVFCNKSNKPHIEYVDKGLFVVTEILTYNEVISYKIELRPSGKEFVKEILKNNGFI